MASRVCPKCNAHVPAGAVAAFSDNVECPNCHTRLEVNPAGRMLASWAGLAAGYLAWRISRGGSGPLGASLPLLYSVLAFGFVSALVTMLAGDLLIAPELPAVEAAPAASHGHDSQGHDGGHH